MDIRQEILKEHSKAQTVKIANYIGNDADRFKDLVYLFLNDEYKVVQRAAWIISHCAEQHPQLIKPYIKAFIAKASEANIHNAVKRNVLRVLQFIEMNDDDMGIAADLCFKALISTTEPSAVKAFAITVLDNICKSYPELKKEFILILQEQLPYQSPAFVSRAKKVLKK